MTALSKCTAAAAALFVGAMLLLLLLGVASHAIGIRINTTHSIPVGLYRTSSAPIEKGAHVLFCPPPHFNGGVFELARERGYIGAGFCPGGYGYMMKRVLAVGRDVVKIDVDGVRVNGELLPLSVPAKMDKAGRPMPHYRTSGVVLGDAEVLLMSDVSATSFDGRYFGPVRRAQIPSVIVALITWQ
jgi:conjugative transfer signal peptidase TraF